MLTFQTQQYVAGLTAEVAYEFLTTFEDRDYQTWWPGVHLQVISYERYPDRVGDRYFLDQYIGDYRVRATEVVVEAVPGRRVLRQVLTLGFRAPIRMLFEFDEDASGVLITHTLTVGFTGLGRVLDPAFRLLFPARFIAALDRHMQEELLLLGELLPTRAAANCVATIPPSSLPAFAPVPYVVG